MDRSAFPDKSNVRLGGFPELEEALLPAPALNISAFYIGTENVYGYRWTDPRIQRRPFMDPGQQKYVYGNKSYSTDMVKKNGRCRPLSSDVGVPLLS